MPSRQVKYWFNHMGQYVFVIAGSAEFAKQKFQNRYGYRPTEPVKIEVNNG